MNIFEKKLYGILNLLSEEGQIVKNKKTGNVYTVKQFDPEKHDKPTPAEVEKTKAANGGKIPDSDKPAPTAKPKQPAGNQPQAKPQQKLGAGDFKSSAEKPKSPFMPGVDLGASFQKLKSLKIKVADTFYQLKVKSTAFLTDIMVYILKSLLMAKRSTEL